MKGKAHKTSVWMTPRGFLGGCVLKDRYSSTLDSVLHAMGPETTSAAQMKSVHNYQNQKTNSSGKQKCHLL